ncbi:TM2 domain-containing protein [Microbacterium sp. p3-SID338]|uniref:TM2 domain-containing protein n=1 Tax=Microbacterium sp. p3-SID338 TaxID=2916214 RepID=UPI0021A55EE4|nr:TM2 domain-containing protein [Microbacterium sp. p3-SID338]MCT1395653.1 TM2 domain-containing protein [Microbacterium sp. p3-SID338]
MTSPESPPVAGWYLNANGQQQWWDGSAWGPLAPGQVPSNASIPTPAAGPSVALPVKTRTAAYWLAILLGGFGAHRFYLRRFGTAWTLLIAAVAQALYRLDGHPTSIMIANIIIAIMWLWIIVDLFRIPSMVDVANRKLGLDAPRR